VTVIMAKRRRGHGEGNVTQRADGRWMARISLGGYGKSRRVKCLYGDTQEEVTKAMRAELVDRDKGRNIDQRDVPTLATFAATWLETVRPTLKPSTARFYDENLTRYILPALGSTRVTAIRRAAVLQLIRRLRAKQLATTTIRGIVRTLSACLSGAVDVGHLDVNPALALRKHLRLGDAEKHEPDPLTVDEARRLVETAREQFSRWYPFVMCGLRTGLRLSELVGLDWTDLDEASSTLAVNRALVRGQLGLPKNHQRRVVDVSPELLKALRVYRRALRAFALRKGRPAPTIMFPAVGGVERLDESNVRKVFTRLCTAAKVRARSPHDMRDTYASQLLSANAPLLYVCQQLGHSSAAVTLKHYATWLPKAEARYVQILDCVSTVCQTGQTEGAAESESA
jgi:integrase